MAVWLVRAGASGENAQEFLECACINIGYGLVDDLTDLHRWPDIRTALYKNNRSATRNVIDQVWQFLWVIQPGDLIVTPIVVGASSALLGRVSEGRPFFDSERLRQGRHGHRRKVDWEPTPAHLNETAIRRYRLNQIRRTVYLITDHETEFWLSALATTDDSG